MSILNCPTHGVLHCSLPRRGSVVESPANVCPYCYQTVVEQLTDTLRIIMGRVVPGRCGTLDSPWSKGNGRRTPVSQVVENREWKCVRMCSIVFRYSDLAATFQYGVHLEGRGLEEARDAFLESVQTQLAAIVDANAHSRKRKAIDVLVRWTPVCGGAGGGGVVMGAGGGGVVMGASDNEWSGEGGKLAYMADQSE